MITRFKKFENVNVPKVGDYVIIDYRLPKWGNKTRLDFMDNIGRVVDINKSELTFGNKGYPYVVKFDNIVFPELGDYEKEGIIGVSLSEILVFSSSVNELKIKLDSKKYNL
jgi:hypothetical protein